MTRFRVVVEFACLIQNRIEMQTEPSMEICRASTKTLLLRPQHADDTLQPLQ